MYINWDTIAEPVPSHYWYFVPNPVFSQNTAPPQLIRVNVPVSRTIRFPSQGLYKLHKTEPPSVTTQHPRSLDQTARDSASYFSRGGFEYYYGLAWKEENFSVEEEKATVLHAEEKEPTMTHIEEAAPNTTPYIEEEGAYIIRDY